MSKLLVVYHGSCDDGFAAAWVAKVAWASHRHIGQPGGPMVGNISVLQGYDGIELFAAHRGRQLPDVEGRDVLYVDFCYDALVQAELFAKANKSIVLDHHKSSMLDMIAWAEKEENPAVMRLDLDNGKASILADNRAMLEFDMNRSGAMMAWDYFSEGSGTPPNLIKYVQDHDIWTKKLPFTEEVCAFIRSFPWKLPEWDALYKTLSWNDLKDDSAAVIQGAALLRYKEIQVRRTARDAHRIALTIGDDIITTWGANCPPSISSEVGEAICMEKGCFSITWYEDDRGFCYSLRSRPNAETRQTDVSEIAKNFGGGGHKAAAGFRSPTPIHIRIQG